MFVCVPACMYVRMYLNKKRMSDPLELELVSVSHLTQVSGTALQSSAREVSIPNYRAIWPSQRTPLYDILPLIYKV